MAQTYLGITPLGLPYLGSTIIGETTVFVYPAATGGIITTDGDFKIHTFTSSADFTVSVGGDFTYLIIGGGGGGTEGQNGCAANDTIYIPGPGGGAGGLVYASSSLVSNVYSIVVGAGGAIGGSTRASNGNNSSFNSLIAFGGGGAAQRAEYTGNGYPTAVSGSGGGASGGFRGIVRFGASCPQNVGVAQDGNQLNGFAGDGSVPGDCFAYGENCDYVYLRRSGAGGGAGGNASGTTGGAGKVYDITGTSVTYAGGGNSTGTQTYVQNTGFGGRGSDSVNSATSGSNGVVIIRYKYQ
jgi:hypothetical protein